MRTTTIHDANRLGRLAGILGALMLLVSGGAARGELNLGGVVFDDGMLFHFKPSLPTPTWIGNDWTYGIEVGGHKNDADLGFIRFGYTPTEHAFFFADAAFYDPESDEFNAAFQVGGSYRLLEMERVSIALRAAFGMPIVEDADLMLFNADLATWYRCPRVRGLATWLALGAGYYDYETDAGDEGDGTVLTVSGGVDYEFLPGVALGLEGNYSDSLLIGFHLRYRF